MFGVLLAYRASRGTDGPSQRAAEVAETIARGGYLLRAVELQLLRGLRCPEPEIERRLHDSHGSKQFGEGWSPTVIGAAWEFATGEPLRPDPDTPDAMSWKVVGLGGDLRAEMGHTITFSSLEAHGYGDGLPTEWTLEELEQLFKWGYFVACCEEALPEGVEFGDDLPVAL